MASATPEPWTVKVIRSEDWHCLTECWLGHVVKGSPTYLPAKFDKVKDRQVLLNVLRYKLLEDDSPKVAIFHPDSDQAVGCFLSDICHAATAKDGHINRWIGLDLSPDTIAKATTADKYSENMIDRENLFEKFCVDRLVHVHTLYVQERYRGQGLSYILTNSLIEEAQRRGFHLMATSATSHCSQIALEKMGFVTIAEEIYDGTFDLYQQMADIEPIHTSIKIVAKKLDS